MLKILILSHSSELSGGAERSMLDLIEYWTSKGYIEPHFIIRRPHAGLEKELHKRNLSYSSIHYTNWAQRNPTKDIGSIFANTQSNGKAIREIEKLIDNIQPDVVMTNTIIAPWAAIAAHYKKVPHVWFVREFGTDHGHIFEIGREKTFHDIGALSKMVITNSDTLAKDIQKFIEPEKVHTLYNPFKMDEIDKLAAKVVKSPFKDANSLKLVVTGRISESKGQNYIAEAVGKLVGKGHNIELCIVGDSSQPGDADALNQVIKEYNISDRVHLVGHQANPLAYVRISDIGIMSSRKEAFGRVTFEYMAIGKPVIGARSGATPELVDNGKTGRLFKSGDADDLAARIEAYIKNPADIALHGKAAQLKARSMMRGANSADSVYKRIARSIESWRRATLEPIYFTERWLDYPQIAQKHIDKSALSLKRMIYRRMRERAKTIYIKLGGRKVRSRR
jgi:glycosyltransferase involved in cell wall biosynthesis